MDLKKLNDIELNLKTKESAKKEKLATADLLKHLTEELELKIEKNPFYIEKVRQLHDIFL